MQESMLASRRSYLEKSSLIEYFTNKLRSLVCQSMAQILGQNEAIG
jgi:hypothetical protein